MIRHSSRLVYSPDVGCWVGLFRAGRQAQRMEKGEKVKSKGREACFLV